MLSELASMLGAQFLDFVGRWDENTQLNTRAYEAMRGLNYWSNAGRHAYEVAWIHYNRARTEDAALWAERCAEAWARRGSKSEQAEATRIRGLVARQRRDYIAAEKFLQDALQEHRDSKEERGTSALLKDLGELMCECEKFDTAEQYYREALGLAENIGDKEGQTSCRGNLGELALDRERWAEARKWFEQELPLAREIGRQELIAGAQYGLSRVHEAEGRADLALPLAQEALKIYKRLQHKDLVEARELVERLKAPPP